MDRFASELDFTDTRPVLFDVGWEVAKKVGGIYTVLKSKSPITVEEFGGRYALVGPYNQATAATEMEEMEPGPLFGPVIARLRERYGIIVHFGKWLVDGYPKGTLRVVSCRVSCVVLCVAWLTKVLCVCVVGSAPDRCEQLDA